MEGDVACEAVQAAIVDKLPIYRVRITEVGGMGGAGGQAEAVD